MELSPRLCHLGLQPRNVRRQVHPDLGTSLDLQGLRLTLRLGQGSLEPFGQQRLGLQPSLERRQLGPQLPHALLLVLELSAQLGLPFDPGQVLRLQVADPCPSPVHLRPDGLQLELVALGVSA